VFGQSAGAAAVRTLLSVPAARGLFRRGIVQSAGFEDYAVVASPSAERVARHSAALFDRLGSRDIDVLRGMPADAVREASLLESGIVPPASQVHTPANLVWYPARDDDVVAEDLSAWTRDVSVLFGTTQDEARFFHRPTGLYSRPDVDPADVYTPQTLATMAGVLAGDRTVLAHHNPYEALAELSTTAVWLEPALASYRRFAGLDRDAYYYRFARVSPAARHSGLLACHGAELPYVFGTLRADDETDLAVSKTLRHAWTEFARTGRPRGPDGAAWPACTREAPRYTLIGDVTEPRHLTVNALTALISARRG
jgi:para-nitrobenzyl esterase